MKLIKIINISLNALYANKARTGLTVLGMVVGIASVIIVFSAGEGINYLIMDQIRSFGGDDQFQTEIKIPTSQKGQSGEQQSAFAMAQGVQVTTLTLEDYDDLMRLPNVKNSYAALLGQELASYGSEARRLMIFGVTSEYPEMDASEIMAGRFFTAAEDKTLAPVIVLGSKAKERFFGGSDPLGKFIKIRQGKFRVIGVMEERGAIMTFDFDDMAYMPLRTLQKRVMGVNHVQMIMTRVEDANRINETAEAARYLLRENHNLPQPQDSITAWSSYPKDDFRVTTMKEAAEIMSTVIGAVTLLLLAIVAISLVVGGVGILNIMYVAVTERTAEIGLRKAVGARYYDIMLQFLTESIMVTAAGGLIGALLGTAVAFLVSWIAGNYGFAWPFAVPLRAYITAVIFSLFFGVIFGLYPARKAAQLDPITALRNE